MSAHNEVEKALTKKGLAFSSATAGIATLTAPNTTLSMQDLSDLINMAKANSYELVFTAGALKLRPWNSSL